MDKRVFLLGLFLFALGHVNGFPMSDLIEKLPGQPNVTFRQFSGYIDVDEKTGRSLFYYFVEAEKDPMNLPLTVWLTGVSNLLFIDSPVGAGWSYSNTSNDYEVGDDSTNKDLLTFILQWFEKYPNFNSRDLYLGGSSYAGHFIPNFANALLDYNKQSNNFKFNVKGLALGNPLLRNKLDTLAVYDFFWLRGMININLHQQILKECNGIDEDNYSNNATKWSESCQQAMDKAEMAAFIVSSINVAKARRFDVLRDPCDEKWEDLVLGKEVTKVSYEVDMCIPFRADFYFNIPEVQKAFHGNRTNLGYQWKDCFETSGLKYNDVDKDIDMLPALKKFFNNLFPLQYSEIMWLTLLFCFLLSFYPISCYSGNQDAIVPTVGTLNHVNKLAKDMNLNLTKDEAWNHDNKGEGWMYSYGNLLTFMIVKGANHHVTFSKSSDALFIFTNVVLNRSH
ncbi:Serine carboxypeptidase 44 [Theobroma cacao]|uniref:Serine carboxypeptidase 44 n=1 Tax=Theobroma cacao TaxID=3641 RepID=A0A061F6Q2_THECC|nr:Serine carboxypeptidase 44 [Theobroma cacao]